MKKRKHNLYLLYQYKDPKGVSEQLIENAYHIILLFSEVGEVSSSDLKKILPENTDTSVLNFRSKEQLLEFAQACLDYLDFHSVFLLASQDYNIGIESCHDLSSFREIFHRYGEHLTDEGKESKERNLFGKLF